jgi:hypothetical protein
MKKGDRDWNAEYRGHYGTVVDFDGEFLYVQMECNGPDPSVPSLIFTRDELSVRRSK